MDRIRVLFIVSDLYHTKGGGQTIYRRIVQTTPSCQFHYFLHNENQDDWRPDNATAIPLRAKRQVQAESAVALPYYRSYALVMANQIARSVANQRFDIVDIPDFQNFGAALRTAFDHHNVTVGKIVLALHGNRSTSNEMNWGAFDGSSTAVSLEDERRLEREQFDDADDVWGCSMRYVTEWQDRKMRPVHFIDPIHFVASAQSDLMNSRTVGVPAIFCVGRSERRKGNDLFVELTNWLRRDSYSVAAHIGDQDRSHFEKSSAELLAEIATHRELEIPHRQALDWGQLKALYDTATVLILPVRYDTLNLVVLESLFSGCPVAISSKAGVCDYLNAHYPSIPYVTIDFDNFYAAVGEIQDLLDHYAQHREKLLAAIALCEKPWPGMLDMATVYANMANQPALGTPDGPELAERFPNVYREGRYFLIEPTIEWCGRLVAATAPPTFYNHLRATWLAPTRFLAASLNHFGIVELMRAAYNVALVPRRLRQIERITRGGGDVAIDTPKYLRDQCLSHIFRCNFYVEIANIERRQGRDLIAAVYELRILRLIGTDKFKLLPRLVDTLRCQGHPREAEAAMAMYSSPEKSMELSYQYLQTAREMHLTVRNTPFELIDDRRGGSARVAVIVSLYEATSKLKLFLDAISNQTLVKRSEVEIILVDSGSPGSERQVVHAFLQSHPISLVYARSAQRESIQAAWNRGIVLASAPYLVFLGVDETLYPEALELLAQELDRNPEVDWAMANSLVTEVNDKGILERDLMTYNRSGARKEHAYLETCYLSWVGGMYRRNIHDRFGYYDETFRASGDTEFKNRVLPYINVKFIPNMFGLFLNYPEERTTAGPRAEIEDLRAWYLHRTPAGIRYAFEHRTDEDARLLLGTALGYRKSYCTHISSDIDYASGLADFLVERKNPDDWIKKLAPDLRTMLRKLRQLEFAEQSPSSIPTLTQATATWLHAGHLQFQHRKLLRSLGFSPCYKIANDNRYEQHSWLWNP